MSGPGLELLLATEGDIEALERLIPRSVHGLQAASYSEAQRRAALGPVFAVDRGLIRDGTYFIVEAAGGGVRGMEPQAGGVRRGRCAGRRCGGAA